MKTDGGTMTRGQFGRWLARGELAIAGLVVFVVQPLWYIAAPESSGPMFAGPDWGPALVIGAIVVQLAALGLMLRWYRADPEPDHGGWRYRAGRTS